MPSRQSVRSSSSASQRHEVRHDVRELLRIECASIRRHLGRRLDRELLEFASVERAQLLLRVEDLHRETALIEQAAGDDVAVLRHRPYEAVVVVDIGTRVYERLFDLERTPDDADVR